MKSFKNVLLCYTISFYVVSCYLMLCCVISCYITLCFDVLCFMTLCCAMLCCDILFHIMSCYVVIKTIFSDKCSQTAASLVLLCNGKYVYTHLRFKILNISFNLRYSKELLLIFTVISKRLFKFVSYSLEMMM